jgi:erythromycin esterase
MKRKIGIIIVCSLLTGFCCAQKPALNLDFEYSFYPVYFKHWSLSGDKSYVRMVDTANSYKGKQSLFVHCKNSKLAWNDHFYFYNNDFIGASAFQGKKIVTLSAWVKGDSLGKTSYATLYANIKGENKEFKYLQSDRLTTNTSNEWKKLTIELPIVGPTTGFVYGGIAQGTGKFWFDHFEISIDGQPVEDKASFISPVSTSETKWLDEQLLEIKRKNDQFNVTRKFYEAIAPASIIALGEATHGTHEFSLIKEQIISDIASKSGKNIVVVFESSFGSALKVNDYVLHGTGSIEKLLNSISNPWRTAEVRELIQWIKNFNTTHENKVMFMGCDMQWVDQEVLNLINYAKTHETELVPKLEKINKRCAYPAIMTNTPATWDSVRKDVNDLEIVFNKKQNSVSGSPVLLAKRSIQLIYQFLGLQKSINPAFRDSCMATNVSWIVENFPDRKIFIWAHNAHIANTNKKMGDFLKMKHGNQYVSVGLLTSFGTYTVVDDNSSATIAMHKPNPETYEYWFSKQRYDNWILNLYSLDQNAKYNWLKPVRSIRMIGAFAAPYEFFPRDILRSYDFLIYLENTRGANFIGLVK